VKQSGSCFAKEYVPKGQDYIRTREWL